MGLARASPAHRWHQDGRLHEILPHEFTPVQIAVPPAKIDTILVVGGGLAGLTTAAALRQHGFTVELVERRETWHAVGVGFRPRCSRADEMLE
jgi:threonine dehydrogenase-like Zn-dependent dehydrogenase